MPHCCRELVRRGGVDLTLHDDRHRAVGIGDDLRVERGLLLSTRRFRSRWPGTERRVHRRERFDSERRRVTAAIAKFRATACATEPSAVGRRWSTPSSGESLPARTESQDRRRSWRRRRASGGDQRLVSDAHGPFPVAQRPALLDELARRAAALEGDVTSSSSAVTPAASRSGRASG